MLRNITTWCFLTLMLSIFISACGQKVEQPNVIIREMQRQSIAASPKALDFRQLANAEWTRVCFFGPYTLKASEALGFEWDLSAHVPMSDDSVETIVFATDSKVTEYLIYPRTVGSFKAVFRQCFSRPDALFIFDPDQASYVHRATQ